MPHTELNIIQKRDIFAVKNRMIDISENLPSNQEIEKCWCGEIESMEHIYMCKEFNDEETEVSYNQLFNGSIKQQIIIYKRFQENMNARERRRKMRLKMKTFPT
jgi:hypothetical protein